MLLALLALALMAVPAKAQDVCEDILCGNLFIEVIRQSANVEASCPASVGVCHDNFRQVAYKVYLKNRKISPSNDPPQPFNLDYSMLDVNVSLVQTSTPLYSHIDMAATQNCFVTSSNGANWNNFNEPNGDKVIFTATASGVAISFANIDEDSPNCGYAAQNGTNNIIRLTPGQPDNAAPCVPPEKCTYVELFTVVVNAYPGESLRLQIDVGKYVAKSTGAVCNALPPVMVGPRNGLISITVNNPITFTGTANEYIEAKLLDKIPAPNGGYIFPIAVKNTGSQPMTITYLEFMLKASLFQLSEQFTYTGISPREYAPAPDPVTGQSTRYLHYLTNAPITLNPSEQKTIAAIEMGPPTVINQSWATGLDFEGAATKPRIKTSSTACTRLKTSGGPVISSSIGDSYCNDPNIHFKVTGIPGGCGDLKAKVELYTTNSATTMQLTKMDFTLEFEFDSPSISVLGVNYPDWPGVGCSLFGCFSGACYSVSPDGKTFNYCFDVPVNAPTSFVLDPSESMEIVFSNTGKGCITKVTLKKLAITYVLSSNACIPRVDAPEGFSICANAIKGTAKTPTGEGIEEVKMNLKGAVINTAVDSIENCASVTCSPSCAADSDHTDQNGAFSFCNVCPNCDYFMIDPEKNDNPLNGVTSYDLVLISKHILAIEPLDSPYKMIAADANKSGSITTFDIVELRKLILGIYTELPKTKSWRFINKDFPLNAQNPFAAPPFLQVANCVAPQSSTVDFIGVKVGDVNNTAVAHGRPSERPSVSLAWPNLHAAPGEALTLPIIYAGDEPMEAVQLGLRFDPRVLQLLGPSQGDLESYLPANFNLLNAAQGEIRTLWLPMTGEPEPVLPGTVLFYLTFKVLAEISETGLPLWLDTQLLDCAAWKPDGTEYALTQAPATSVRAGAHATESEAGLQACVRPNPSSDSATLSVRAAKPGKARIALLDAFGKRLSVRELQLTAGHQDIPLPDAAGLPAGVYFWSIFTPTETAQGHLVKQ